MYFSQLKFTHEYSFEMKTNRARHCLRARIFKIYIMYGFNVFNIVIKSEIKVPYHLLTTSFLEATGTWTIHSVFISFSPALTFTFRVFLTGLSWQNDFFCFVYHLNQSKTANHFIEKNQCSAWYYLVSERKRSVFWKKWTKFGNFQA